MTPQAMLLNAETGAPVSATEQTLAGTGDLRVWALDVDQHLVPTRLAQVVAREAEQTFLLRCTSGRQLAVAASHSLLTFMGWQRMDELAIGARVAVARRTPAPLSAVLDWSDARIGLLAHLIGDGCVLRKQPVHYTSEDEANLEYVSRSAEQEFGITPRRVQQGNWAHVYLPNPRKSARGCRNPLHDWFVSLGIENLRSLEKRVPDALYAGDDRQIALFLHHLWATDGRISEPSSMSGAIGHASYASTSRALIDGVVTLLARLGIQARVRTIIEKRSVNPCYRAAISGGDDLRRFAEQVGAYGARGQRAERLLSELTGRKVNTNVDSLPLEVWGLVKAERLRVGMTERQLQAGIDLAYCGSTLYKSCPSRQRLTRIATVLQSQLLHKAATTDVFWDRIAEIEPLGLEPVHGVSAAGTTNVIINGLVIQQHEQRKVQA